MYDTLHNPSASSATVNLVNNVLDIAKHLGNIDISGLKSNMRSVVTNFESTDDAAKIQNTIKDLNKKYRLDNDILTRSSQEIDKLSDAVADAITTLERQIRIIEERSGKNKQSRALRDLKAKLSEELKYKRYSQGLLDFMTTAQNYLQTIGTTLDSITHNGDDLQYAHDVAAATSKAISLRDAYYNVIKTVANKELISDFAISDADKIALKNLASDLQKAFDQQYEKVRSAEREAMVSLGKNFIGEHNALYGKDVVDIIDMKEADGSLTDYLYSIGRSSNTVISMLGAIVRDAQLNRDRRLSDISL